MISAPVLVTSSFATPDVYKLVEHIRAKGGNGTREPGPVKGGNHIIAFVKDPDGYTFELIQRVLTPEPLCQIMLRVGDLERAVSFYEKALGMKLLRRIERPKYKYNIAINPSWDMKKKTRQLFWS